SGMRKERSLIAALARIKGAAATVNGRMKILEKDMARAIEEAAAEVAAGQWDEHFPVDVFQTGSGTSSNMNANEVLANLAGERLQACLPRLAELPLGGTATGTGINAPKGFARAVIKLLAENLELPLTEARDHFEAQGARDALVEASGMLRTIAVSLVKIANDIRWISCGATAGLADIHLPDLQPGSSIMPGKVNPVIPEVVVQVAAQVI